MRWLPRLVLAAVLASGCGRAPSAVDSVVEPVAHRSSAAPLTRCELAGPKGVVALAASRTRLVLATASGDGLELRRFAGHGCDLLEDGSAPIAVETLLDVDDLGNVFAFPRESSVRGVVSTKLPGDFAGDTVAKIDSGGRVTRLVSAPRGIWGFGVSPEGGSLWISACGPNGIFTTSSSPLAPLFEPPQTSWAQQPSVLTSNATFWSVGHRTCSWSSDLSPACGFKLVRTTPEDSREVGTTVVDFGKGFEQGALARCGDRVCGVFSRTVLVWDEEGAVAQTIAVPDSEQLVQVSGGLHGVYLLLRGKDGLRVIFEPVHR